MAKSDLVGGGPRRDLWPWWAKVCEDLYKLGQFLQTNTFFKNDDVEAEIPLLGYELLQNETLKEHLNRLISDIPEGKLEITDSKLLNSDKLQLLYKINEVGMALAECVWWERYETISGTMGTDCILSIKTAESFYKNDPLILDLENKLSQVIYLIKEQYNVNR